MALEDPSHPATLQAAAAELMARWQLEPDGDPETSSERLVQPVRTDDGRRSQLEVQAPADAGPAITALKSWRGEGAVEVHRALPSLGGVLFDRTDPVERSGVDADEVARAAAVARRLHVPASPALPRFGERFAREIALLAGPPRGVPLPPQVAAEAARLAHRLAQSPDPVTLHGDLWVANLVATPGGDAATRPVGFAGDRHLEAAAPLLHASAAGEELQELFWITVDSDRTLQLQALRDAIVTMAGIAALSPDADVSRCIVVARTIGAIKVDW